MSPKKKHRLISKSIGKTFKKAVRKRHGLSTQTVPFVIAHLICPFIDDL